MIYSRRCNNLAAKLLVSCEEEGKPSVPDRARHQLFIALTAAMLYTDSAYPLSVSYVNFFRFFFRKQCPMIYDLVSVKDLEEHVWSEAWDVGLVV